jgi:chromosome segregation ATPase
MTVTAIATPRKNDLGGRQSLCEAIARAASAREEMDAIKEAIERAHALSMASRRKLEAAMKAISAAKASDAEALADALVQGANTTPLQTIRRAREEEIEAADAVAAARSAVARLESDLKDAEAAAMRADKAVRAAIAVVLKPVAERMTEEASALRAQYLTRMFAIGAMSDLGGVARLIFAISDAEHRQLSASVGRTWEAAIAALKTDSDALLPNDTPPT